MGVEIIIFAVLLCGVAVSGQETLDDRIQAVFGNASALNNNTLSEGIEIMNERAGFDVIVQPEPIVEVSLVDQRMNKKWCVPESEDQKLHV